MLNIFLAIKVMEMVRFLRNAVALLHEIATGNAKIAIDGSVTFTNKHA
jgi:hypothetical protein